MMKKIIHLFFPVIMLSLFSCHDTEAKHEMEEPDFDGFVKISLQSQITGVQPMTGIVLWADNAKRNTDAISLEYSYMQYTDIVKEKGVYDWTPLEQISMLSHPESIKPLSDFGIPIRDMKALCLNISASCSIMKKPWR